MARARKKSDDAGARWAAIVIKLAYRLCKAFSEAGRSITDGETREYSKIRTENQKDQRGFNSFCTKCDS